MASLGHSELNDLDLSHEIFLKITKVKVALDMDQWVIYIKTCIGYADEKTYLVQIYFSKVLK